MNIRCERCSTTYELDDALLAPEGSPVQCTKCQHVFTAVPPRTAGRTLIGVPAAPAPHPVAPARSAPHEPPVSSSRQGPAIYRPTQSATSGGGAGAARARRDTMGAFESRLKASARLRWLIPLVVVAILVVVAAAWALLSRRVDPDATRRHAEAMALVALDDIESLEKAGRTLEELASAGAGIDTVDADRALAKLLLSAAILEDVSGPAAQLAGRVAERDRIVAAAPVAPVPGAAPDAALISVKAEIEALRGQVEPRQATARALSDQAYGALKQVAAERGREIAVARALAIHFASIGDREQALRFIRAAGASADKDPWVRLAEGWLDAREEGRESRERAVAKLTELVTAHPEIVRARILLARTQAGLGKREVAAATLDGLLAVNPRHRRAARFKAELVAAPAPQPAPAQVAPPAPRPLPRPVGAPAPAPAALPPRPAIPPAQQAIPAAPPAVAPALAPAAPRPGAIVPPRPPAAPPAGVAPPAAPAPTAAPAAPTAVQPQVAPPAPPAQPEPRKAAPAPAAEPPGMGPTDG